MRYRKYIKNFPLLLKSLLPIDIDFINLEIWQQDETRIGQQGSLSRIWAPTGTRPRKFKQQQFISTYIYGAVCAKTGNSFALIMPYTNTKTMEYYLAELSKQVEVGVHIALVIDNAGWHVAKELAIPDNITLVPLPAYAPELNAMEQVWQWIKPRYLSNCCFKDYDDLVNKACYAWNQFTEQPELVKSLCIRDWIQTP
jgi:transposase